MFNWINIFDTAGDRAMLSWACYPVLGAMVVSISVFCYEHLYKYRHNIFKVLFPNRQPSISIFVPAHNEQATLVKTVSYLDTIVDYAPKITHFSGCFR